jgi:hypothetical protein
MIPNISGGYVPKNHDPHNPEAIKKWMEKLPNVQDLRITKEIDEKYEFLKLKFAQQLNNNLHNN